MKASALIAELQKLIDKHGDLQVQADFKTGRITTFGSASVRLGHKINYATPKPYSKKAYIHIGHVDFNQEKENGQDVRNRG